MIAALFVRENGPYFGLSGVDPWDEKRDARKYPGPYPVVAHPPCERWGRYWGGGPMLHGTSRQKKLGDDAGCFASALQSVRTWGGVLEHPEGSHAWTAFGLTKPPKDGGWIPAGDGFGYTCCVYQGAYGHKALKATWLYAVNTYLPTLAWGRPKGDCPRIDPGYHSSAEAKKAREAADYVPSKRLTERERVDTPFQFRDLLIALAEKHTF